MKPKFVICRLGAQNKVPTIDNIIKKSDLDIICRKLTNQDSYDVIWEEKRIKGKMFYLETDKEVFFITFTPKEVGGRNSYLQSVPTAFASYVETSIKIDKKSTFCIYFTPFIGRNQTRYHQFMYKLLVSMGVKFINPETGLRGLHLSAFTTVKELIDTRENNSSRNKNNQSSYITDEGMWYYVYGKTFGANQKETTMFCLALCCIADKPIKLFQISDNSSSYLSESDISAIKNWTKIHGRFMIDILDDTYEFTENNEPKQPISTEENLRDPRFIFNLLEKTGGHKRCSLCGCEIESIIQGAHIYPVHAIKRQRDLDYETKLQMATDKNNGLWLCENHHKLFDRGLIKFYNGKMLTLPKLSESNICFVNKISPFKRIENEYYNAEMQKYFYLREQFYKAEGYY